MDDVYDRRWDDDFTSHLSRHVSVVIHQVIHAFYNIYACKCPGCGAAVGRAEGDYRHGSVWIDSVLACQRAIQSVLSDTSLPIDAQVEKCLVNEMYRASMARSSYGEQLFSVADIRCWNDKMISNMYIHADQLAKWDLDPSRLADLYAARSAMSYPGHFVRLSEQRIENILDPYCRFSCCGQSNVGSNWVWLGYERTQF